MGYFIMGMQLLLSLSILVTLHEFGHYWTAKKFGMRVEKFYLFFNPGFSLYRKKIGETEYGIGWLPLGGYVRISGMMDESMDREAMAQAPQPWEYRSKPAWQRLIVMIGGVTVNFLLGIFLFAMVSWIYGDKYLPAKNAVHGIAVSGLATEMGLQDGDKILAIGNDPFDKFNSGVITAKMLLDEVFELTIERGGEKMTLTVPDSTVVKLTKYGKKKIRLFEPRIPFVANVVVKKSPAEAAGLQKEDSIVACNDIPTPFFNDFLSVVSKEKDSDVKIDYYRNGTRQSTLVHTSLEGKVGMGPYGPDRYFDLDTINYGLLESFPVAMGKSYDFLGNQVKAFSQMFANRIKAKDSLGGVISIGKMFPPYWDWEYFWRMTAILSLILGFMNLLPIPALDGGYVLFLLFEIIAGRPMNQKVLDYAQMAGIILLLGLLLFANGLDIYGLFFPS
ncbi:MAG: Membrane-associated zinc metalloprotease [uncultured Aureispira sp.]|uniref:Zinc metalloprotease n=1 Tax=uncultured Aureispira sp. TaxID=1331704 RepID=A0A6S6UAG5_9BACT|nr:MAG: Membrane-associated zinc metalloprotease [uncultured Aureispira sp.]